jgi:hypothetical protein
VNHQFAALRFREWLRDKFSGLSGREVAELAPAFILHDPVVETVIRHDVDDCGRNGTLLSITTERMDVYAVGASAG